MDLEKELPEFYELDIEFSNNIKMLYDIFAYHFNKRIQTINILQDDLYEWTRNELKAYKKWEIGKSAWCDPKFPYVNKEKKIDEFSSVFDISIDIYINLKENCGFAIQIYSDRNFLYWYIGQWYPEHLKGKELFDFNFYNKLKKKIENKYKQKMDEEKLEIKIVYPNTENEDKDNKDSKFIGFSIPFTVIDNKNIISEFHEIFKKEVLKPLFEHIKGIKI